jgi:SAM-dependent methyltransferase
MESSDELPELYTRLADWWPALSAPEDYAEEAAFYRQALQSASSFTPKTLLELGSGGGNNASHLKAYFQLTLVDRSPGMLEVSRRLNPECEHFQGDMRSVRLGRQFDLVFIHDAIMYMRTEADLARAIDTAYAHCRPGGAALFAPDCTRETFCPSTRHGGHDRGPRALRYLEWTWDPDPADSTYQSCMVYLLREGPAQVRSILDTHILGLFNTATWLDTIALAGFVPSALPFEHSELEPESTFVFLGLRPEDLHAG